MRDYFPKVNGKRMPGSIFLWIHSRMGGPKPGDNLILIELNTHETADGKLARTYAFADGHAEEVVASDRESADDYFKSWVKENWGTDWRPAERIIYLSALAAMSRRNWAPSKWIFSTAA